MKFSQFLEYIDEEHIFSEMMSRYNDGANYSELVANAKVSMTCQRGRKEGSAGANSKNNAGPLPLMRHRTQAG